jgi:hypothetical protein
MIPVPVGVARNTRSVVGRNVRYLAHGHHFLHLRTFVNQFQAHARKRSGRLSQLFQKTSYLANLLYSIIELNSLTYS